MVRWRDDVLAHGSSSSVSATGGGENNPEYRAEVAVVAVMEPMHEPAATQSGMTTSALHRRGVLPTAGFTADLQLAAINRGHAYM
jgi:hypothetical protein